MLLVEFLCEGDELGLTTTLRTKAMLPVIENRVLIKIDQKLGNNYVLH